MQLGNSKADPDDALELQLVRIWEKVLAVEAVATTDDFFALGGDSLAAAMMLAAVEKFCGVDATRIFFARSYDCPKTRRSNQEWRLG